MLEHFLPCLFNSFTVEQSKYKQLIFQFWTNQIGDVFSLDLYEYFLVLGNQ